MLIKITSDNPELLSLLQKNPNSFGGLQMKQIKNGTGIGWIVSPGEYHLLFQDTKYSFSEKDFSNQIDFQSYCSPRVFLTLATEFLRHMLYPKQQYFPATIPWLEKTVEEVDTDQFDYTLEIENIYADSFSLRQGFVFEKFFPEVKLTHKLGTIFSLKIQTKSLYRLINLAALTCMYLASTNDQYWYLSTDLVKKYVRIIKNLEPVPYFVLYLFAKRCIRSQEDFEALKPELSSAFAGDLKLVWGNTQEMRLRAVGSFLVEDGKINSDVIEVGCGEMDYARRYLRKMDDHRWIATDLVNYSYLVKKLSGKLKSDRLVFIQNLLEQDVEVSDNLSMLMVEVIEHLEMDDSKNMVVNYLTRFQPKMALITTPNAAFNKYFGFDKEYRHEDHKFELTPEQFREYISDCLAKINSDDRPHYEINSDDQPHYEAEFFGIGDCVDGDYLSLGAILRR